MIVLFFIAVVSAFNLRGEMHAKKAEQFRLEGNFQKTIDEALLAKNFFFNTTPMGIPADFYAGIGNYQSENYRQAISFFQSSLACAPYHLLSLHFTGTCYGMLGDEKSAVKYYRQALEISDDLDYSKINLAMSYYNLKQYEDAFTALAAITDTSVIKSNAESVKAILQRPENAKQMNFSPGKPVLESFKEIRQINKIH
ncbi:MAG: tetratricopeptide repeat protein [Bacteroidetes bacterium]|nr:tetratricopeptide repeat protein [Bacteroidota bacterium]